MYLKIPGKNIEIIEMDRFKKRFTSLKFQLNTLQVGLYFPKCKILDTYFYCQRVDAIFTDNDNKILYMHANVKSEKRKIHWKAKRLYIFPLGTCRFFDVGDTLRIKEK